MTQNHIVTGCHSNSAKFLFIVVKPGNFHFLVLHIARKLAFPYGFPMGKAELCLVKPDTFVMEIQEVIKPTPPIILLKSILTLLKIHLQLMIVNLEECKFCLLL